MVVAALLGLALALPTGALFGVGYGTGVRIGYEQVYPLLFPKTATRPSPEQTATNIKAINQIYNTIGGKEASQMGIAQGITQAGELLKNPDFLALEAQESKLSTLTPLNSPPMSAFETAILPHLVSAYEHLEELARRRENTSTSSPTTILTSGADAFLENQTGETEEFGAEEIGNTYGYAAMTKTELLNDQPGFIQPRPSAEAMRKRQIEWDYYYGRIAQSEKDARDNLTPTIVQPTKETNAIDIEAYISKRLTLKNQVHVTKNNYDGWVNPLTSSSKGMSKNSMTGALTNTYNVAKAKSQALNLWQNAEKLLINHITLARNNLATKALANHDWNIRFWKI